MTVTTLITWLGRFQIARGPFLPTLRDMYYQRSTGTEGSFAQIIGKISHLSVPVSLFDAFKYRQHVVLVGGFAANDWLFDNVQRSLNGHGLKVLRPDDHVYVWALFLRI